jgi:hemerythrin-like metal-binding protein
MGIYWINEESIPGIDYEPEKLNHILTKLENAQAGEDDVELTQATLNKLQLYTRVYFSIEEQLMNRYSYPGQDAHLREHQEIGDSIQKFIDRMQSGDVPTIAELLVFLKGWQNHHTRITDRDLGDYIAKGVHISISEYA